MLTLGAVQNTSLMHHSFLLYTTRYFLVFYQLSQGSRGYTSWHNLGLRPTRDCPGQGLPDWFWRPTQQRYTSHLNSPSEIINILWLISLSHIFHFKFSNSKNLGNFAIILSHLTIILCHLTIILSHLFISPLFYHRTAVSPGAGVRIATNGQWVQCHLWGAQ